MLSFLVFNVCKLSFYVWLMDHRLIYMCYENKSRDGRYVMTRSDDAFWCINWPIVINYHVHNGVNIFWSLSWLEHLIHFSLIRNEKEISTTSLPANPCRPVQHDSLLSKTRVDRLLDRKTKWSKMEIPRPAFGVFIFLYSPYLPIFLAPILTLWYVTFFNKKMCFLNKKLS